MAQDALSTEYAEAIRDALDAVSKRHGAGSMNAAMGALLSTQARFIASVPDRKTRRALVDAMERQLPQEIKRHMEAGTTQRVEVIKFEGSA